MSLARRVAIISVFSAIYAAPARTDQLFHTVTMPFEPTELGHPVLRAGQTVHTHTESPGGVNVIESFQIEGALPNTAYTVVGLFQVGGCGGYTLPLPRLVLETDGHGNAHGRDTISKATEDFTVSYFGINVFGLQYVLNVGVAEVEEHGIMTNYDPGLDAYRAACFTDIKGDPSHDGR